MSLANLMTQTVNVFRPIYAQQGSEAIVAYQYIYAGLPVSIQPMTSMTAFFYNQRGLENMVTIYTSETGFVFHRMDLLEWTDQNGTVHDFHVQGIQNGLMKNIYIQFDASEYPAPAKKILDLKQTGTV